MNKTKLEAVHTLAMRRWNNIQSTEREQRELAIEDMLFANAEDGMYSDDEAAKNKGKPCFTINRIAGAIDQLVGDERQNQTAITVNPIGSGATEELATTFSGLIRNIENVSNAHDAYSNAFAEACTGGYGGFKLITEYEDEGFNQQIRIEPIKSATSSLFFDVAATSYDKRDTQFAFLITDMPKAEYEDKYPDSDINSWSSTQVSNSCSGWVNEDSVRLAEYWVKTPVTKEIALLSDGRVIDLDDDGSVIDELAEQGITVTKTRKVDSHKVEMYILDASGVIGEAQEWAGKHIPLVPVFGRQNTVEGKTFTRGIVRQAKDPSRIYNFLTSNMVEAAAMSLNQVTYFTPTQVEGHEQAYKNHAISNSRFLPYNPDPDTGGAPPQKSTQSVADQNSLVQLQQASMDLYATTGMTPLNMGANPELKSGKAIEAQQRLGDRGSFVFTDNLAKSVQFAGEIMLDLIPRIMDTAMQIRVLSPDGTTSEVEINTVNQEIVDAQTGEKILVNDLSVGTYGLVVDQSPAHSTQRTESANQIMQLINQSPEFSTLALDLVAKDLPILESKELAKRVRMNMIKAGTVEPTKEEIEELGLNQPQGTDPQQQALTDNILMQSEKLKSEIEYKDAQIAKLQVESQRITIEAQQKLMETLVTKIDAGIPLTAADRNMMIAQGDIVDLGQQSLDEGPNSEQTADIVAQMQQGIL